MLSLVSEISTNETCTLVLLQACDNDAGCPLFWDLYNVSDFITDELGLDYVMLYMPLLAFNEGQHGYPPSHQWFAQWEAKGDSTIRYFVEPVILTVRSQNPCLSACSYPCVNEHVHSTLSTRRTSYFRNPACTVNSALLLVGILTGQLPYFPWI